MTQHQEPLPLFLVTHRGALAVNDYDLIASRVIADHSAGPVVETLVELTPHQAQHLTQMVNVLGIIPAPAGDFLADDATVVRVAADGSWHRPHHAG
jgi:hypothetical protein